MGPPPARGRAHLRFSSRRSPDLQAVVDGLHAGAHEPGRVCGPAKKLRPHRRPTSLGRHLAGAVHLSPPLAGWNQLAPTRTAEEVMPRRYTTRRARCAPSGGRGNAFREHALIHVDKPADRPGVSNVISGEKAWSRFAVNPQLRGRKDVGERLARVASLAAARIPSMDTESNRRLLKVTDRIVAGHRLPSFHPRRQGAISAGRPDVGTAASRRHCAPGGIPTAWLRVALIPSPPPGACRERAADRQLGSAASRSSLAPNVNSLNIRRPCPPTGTQHLVVSLPALRTAKTAGRSPRLSGCA